MVAAAAGHGGPGPVTDPVTGPVTGLLTALVAGMVAGIALVCAVVLTWRPLTTLRPVPGGPPGWAARFDERFPHRGLAVSALAGPLLLAPSWAPLPVAVPTLLVVSGVAVAVSTWRGAAVGYLVGPVHALLLGALALLPLTRGLLTHPPSGGPHPVALLAAATVAVGSAAVAARALGSARSNPSARTNTRPTHK